MSFPSPNHGERRGTQRPDLIVIHYTGMADFASARARLCDPSAEVSAHWLIDADGTTEALVPENRRAWHAGAGSWQGRGDVNSHSIGIELANPGDRPFPHPQMTALEALLAAIMARWAIPPHRVIAHSDMAPGRKSDPGPRFDWGRLGRLGLALAPARAAPDAPLAVMLDRIGYPPTRPEARLAAFRQRFCPWNDGPENDLDRRTAAGVLAALPLEETC
jgi:N-acetylmuramoyl-L-alanine amidase